MSQVDNFQVPAHPSGLEMRTQLNQIVLALVSANNGPVAPVQTFPLMWWGDTTAGRLRIRNSTNDAWVDLGPIDDFLADIRTLVTTTAALKVSRTGDYMTGPLQMRSANVMFQNPAQNWFGYLGSYGTAGQAGSGIGFVDSSLTLWNFQVNNDGSASVRTNLTVSGAQTIWGGRLNLRQAQGALYGELAMFSSDGTTMFMRGQGGGGGMQWVNHNYDNVCGTMDNAGNLQVASQLRSGNGGGILGTNGDVFGGAWANNWLSTYITNTVAGRASAGAVCPWNGSEVQVGGVAIGGGDVVQPGSPWVIVGLNTSPLNNVIAARVAHLRNQ
jgi:hypothetical protein